MAKTEPNYGSLLTEEQFVVMMVAYFSAKFKQRELDVWKYNWNVQSLEADLDQVELKRGSIMDKFYIRTVSTPSGSIYKVFTDRNRERFAHTVYQEEFLKDA